MKRLRVLVCGTNYGRIYMDAIALKQSRYELAGVLALGSPRSRKVAAQHRAPLFQSVEELPGDIDLACAAMGTPGSEAVLALLDRGIHVLCEHPLRPEFLQAALARASEQNLCFHVNAHLAMLPPARKFIADCRRLLNGKPPAFVNVMATDRSLYATTDLLRHLMPDFPAFHMESRSAIPQFTILNGSFGSTGTSFQIQGSLSADGTIRPDGGAGYLVDCRVEVATSAGMLTLMSINGPVVWNANYGGPLYGFQTYQKTPYMLSMLGGIVGDEAVQRAMSDYAKTWAFKHPSPWDYMNFMSNALKQDLGWFWYYWLWTTESVDGSIENVTTAAGKTTVIVKQDGQMPSPVVLKVTFKDKADQTFTFPADVWFNGSKTYKAVLDLKGKAFDKIQLDPGGRFPDHNIADNSWPR